MTEFATQRLMMVDTQIRPSDVTKFPIIDAFLSVRREMFVPDAFRDVAYVGDNISLGEGRCVLEPRTLAKMLDVLDIQPDEMVLDLGTGLGYSAAILAHMAEAVIAVEEDEGMAADAQASLVTEGADNAVVVEALLAEGAPKYGPYDVVIVQGAVESMPSAILDQIKTGGRIVAMFAEGALGEVRVGHKTATGMTWRMVFNAGAPVLPGFTRQAEFAL